MPSGIPEAKILDKKYRNKVINLLRDERETFDIRPKISHVGCSFKNIICVIYSKTPTWEGSSPWAGLIEPGF